MSQQRDMQHALERVYSGDQSIEAGCVLDALADLGWLLDEAPPVAPGQLELPAASTKPLPKRRSA